MNTQSMLMALADSLTSALNTFAGGDTSVAAFTASTQFLPMQQLEQLPQFDPTDANTLLVYVIPMDDDEEATGLGRQFRGTFEVEIIIYARVGSGSGRDTLCRTLMDLREQIRQLVKPRGISVPGRVTSGANALAIKGNESYMTKDLLLNHVFVSSQLITFVVPT